MKKSEVWDGMVRIGLWNCLLGFFWVLWALVFVGVSFAIAICNLSCFFGND